ncbi:cytochrome C assembly family protein [Biformimicrobium ophioploci]|uniref:Cytochrome c biogenesis protein CcsA n=1 Tax=Biformimicrobium ophioploci TaxID=3036711 RepID=A0ABQ6LZJ7_9GAMM|nr:cytochrome c biogenesis protein CcsA [Microbulbifer sp. NKW57]GMG87520.1 cytochrome c biogenesis protein CcsA [Microbulbifer sp. NKW57]
MFHWLTFAFYAASAVPVIASLARSEQPRKLPSLALFAIAVACHAVALWQSVVSPEGYRLDFSASLSLVLLTVNFLVLLLTLRHPLQLLLPLLAPAGLLAESAAFYQWGGAADYAKMSPELASHIALSVAAYSLLTIATLQALYLAFQNHQLRHGRLGGISRFLPPLQSMEHLLFWLLALGELLLTASLITGLLFVDDILGQHLLHKTVLSLVAWALYAVLLWGHWRWGWRGSTAVRWTLGAFAALMLAYFGSKLVLEIILDRA